MLAFVLIAVLAAASSIALVDEGALPSNPGERTANGCPLDVPWTEAVVAQALGLPAWEYERMRDARALTPQDFCTMPRDKLDRARAKATEPAPEHPGEWARFRTLQQADENGNVAPDAHITASRQRAALVSRVSPAIAGIFAGSWTSVGPGNIGGRVRAISPNPSNGNDILVGGVAGGVWRTLDGGASWTVVDDFMGNLAISTIVRDPSNPQVVYAGTGEGFFNSDSARGYGIFKSTDGGASWALIPGTTPSVDPMNINWGFFYVNRIAVHPTNSQILLAATSGFSGGAFLDCNTGGLLRSIDGGANWTMVYNRRALDVKFDPNNANRVLVAEGSHCVSPSADFTTVMPALSIPTFHGSAVAVSTDGGATFTYPTARHEFEPSHHRVEIAWANATSGLVLASLDSNGGAGGAGLVYFSTDGGATWAYNSQPAHLGVNLGWYANTIWVDPTDSRRVVGGRTRPLHGRRRDQLVAYQHAAHMDEDQQLVHCIGARRSPRHRSSSRVQRHHQSHGILRQRRWRVQSRRHHARDSGRSTQWLDQPQQRSGDHTILRRRRADVGGLSAGGWHTGQRQPASDEHRPDRALGELLQRRWRFLRRISDRCQHVLWRISIRRRASDHGRHFR